MNSRAAFWRYLRDPLALLWRIGASRRLGLFLFAALALVLLLSLCFPQVSPGQDATAYAQWLGAVRHRYGMVADWALAWGLEDVRGSWLFRLLLVLLAFNLLISLADRLNAAPADRFKRAQVRALLPHLGMILALAALLLGERIAWQEDIALAEGQPYSSARLGGLVLGADAVQVLFDGRGAAVGWQSDLSLADQGQEVARGQVRAGRPWLFRDWFFWQTGFGLSAELVAIGEGGREEAVQALLAQGTSVTVGQKSNVLSFRASGEEGYFAVPGRGLSFRLIGYDALPQRGIEGGVIQIQAYRSGQITPLWEAFLQDRASLTLDGVEYQFMRSHYALLRVSFAPGVWVLIAGLALTLGWPAVAAAPGASLRRAVSLSISSALSS